MQRTVYAMALVLAGALSAAALAQAQTQPDPAMAAQNGGYVETSIPLVTIRFNQRSVHFEKSLSGAVAQALAVKPDAVFDAVLKPGTASASGDQALAKVINALHADGIPDARIRPLRTAGAGAAYDQVDLFVH